MKNISVKFLPGDHVFVPVPSKITCACCHKSHTLITHNTVLPGKVYTMHYAVSINEFVDKPDSPTIHYTVHTGSLLDLSKIHHPDYMFETLELAQAFPNVFKEPTTETLCPNCKDYHARQ